MSHAAGSEPHDASARAPGLSRRLRHFFFGSASILFVALLSAGLTLSSAPRVLVFQLAVCLSHSALYLLPALCVTLAVRGCVALLARRRAARMDGFVLGAAVLSVSCTHLVLLADRSIYALYGFHLNGFVWNLATTPGGLESLGAGASTQRTIAATGAGFLALHWAWMWLCGRPSPAALGRFVPSRGTYRATLVLLALLALGERVAYGISEVQDYVPVLVAADAFPLYGRLTFRSLAARLGFEGRPRSGLDLPADAGNLCYPLAPLAVHRPTRPLNVVWLVAESLRADALQTEIMPASSAFALRAIRAEQHYSGGNGTRMGMFSMFYGLHGSYWFSFLRERRGPVLIDVLADQGYQLGLYTSARFTYPEFDQTIFAAVADEHLHECASGASWERDRENVGRLLDFVAARDAERPFFVFQFFESPHAPYDFPPESAFRTPYLEDLNYATMDVEGDVELIRNRYLNACRHLDSQWARVLDFLEREGLLESTLVVLTGDHGEEFQEKGRWGHNSEFVEEQIRVPLVLWIPGEPARAIEAMTSHVDLPATILPRLGVTSPAADYCLGRDVLGGEHDPFLAVSDWSRVCFVDADAKISFGLKSAGFLRNRVSTLDDVPRDESAVLAEKRVELGALLRELGRFRDVEVRSVVP